MVKQTFCPNCGARIKANARFCPMCGAQISRSETMPIQGSTSVAPEADLPQKLEWDFDIPFFNRFWALDILKAVGIAGLVVVIILLLVFYSSPPIGGYDQSWMYALGLVGLVVFLVIIVLLVVYRSRYEAHYRIDSRGAGWTTRKRTRKKNAVINGLLFFMGLLSGKPGAVGTAILGEAQQTWSMQWKDVREIKVYPKQHAVMLKSSWKKLLIYCTPENYETVVKMCSFLHRQAQAKVSHKRTSKKKAL